MNKWFFKEQRKNNFIIIIPQSHTTAEEKLLWQACTSGSAEAQRQLYDRYKAKMFGMALRYAGDRQEAEDYLQDGFIQVFKDLSNFRCEGSLEGWVRRVILMTIFQNLRRQKNGLNVVDSAIEEHWSDEEGSNEFMLDTPKELIKLMQKLPTGFRTVLNLYVLEGYSHAEIAEILGISVGTSKSQYMRAKASLRSLFEKKLNL